MWREGAANPLPAALDQVADYLERLKPLAAAYLVLFDQRTGPRRWIPQAPEIVEHRGKTIEIRRY